LAELDFTVNEIEKRVTVRRNGTIVPSLYEVHVQGNDPLVWENNYILHGLDKTNFIEQYAQFYVMHIDSHQKLFEMFHEKLREKNDGKFLTPRLDLLYLLF
jgi:hypothetical protein